MNSLHHLPVLKICGGKCCSDNGAATQAEMIAAYLQDGPESDGDVDLRIWELAKVAGKVQVVLKSNCLKCGGKGPEGVPKAALHANTASAELHNHDPDRKIIANTSPTQLESDVEAALDQQSV